MIFNELINWALTLQATNFPGVGSWSPPAVVSSLMSPLATDRHNSCDSLSRTPRERWRLRASRSAFRAADDAFDEDVSRHLIWTNIHFYHFTNRMFNYAMHLKRSGEGLLTFKKFTIWCNLSRKAEETHTCVNWAEKIAKGSVILVNLVPISVWKFPVCKSLLVQR